MIKNTDFTQPFYDAAASIYKSFPKTIPDVKSFMEKAQGVIKTEFDNTQTAMQTYTKACKGNSNSSDILIANAKMLEVSKTIMFSTMIMVPGMLVALPTLINNAKKYNIELVPASIASKFNI